MTTATVGTLSPSATPAGHHTGGPRMGINFKRAGFLAGSALAIVGMVVGPAGAAAPINGAGKVRCTVIGTVKYKPPLKVASSGPGTTTLKTTLTCGKPGSTGDGLHLASGKSTTKTTHSTTDCATVLQPPTPQPGTGTVKWKQTTGTSKQNPSSITLTSTGGTTTPTVTVDSSGPVNAGGSYHGETATSHAVIQESQAQIFAACAGKGLKILHIIAGSTLDLD